MSRQGKERYLGSTGSAGSWMTRTLSTVSILDGKWHRDAQAICDPTPDRWRPSRWSIWFWQKRGKIQPSSGSLKSPFPCNQTALRWASPPHLLHSIRALISQGISCWRKGMYRVTPAAQNGNTAVTLLSQAQAMFMSLSSIKSGTVSAKARKAVQRSCGNAKALAQSELKPDFSKELCSYVDL